jgi:indolepyruvate ferredoxin oxidoreductase alpha subunit
MEDYILAMGAGMGASHGISKAGGKQPVALMGESTFFHSGIPALINAVYNKSNVLLIILDNGATAMTGHQPNPASGITGMGETTKRVSVEDVAKACGAEVATVNPFDVRKMSAVISELMKKEGVKVLVSRQLCRLIFMRNARKNKIKVPVYWIDPKKCKKCGVCVQYGCPAIHVDKPKRYYIDPDFCWGCTVCSQVCPYNAISVRMEPEKKEVKK